MFSGEEDLTEKLSELDEDGEGRTSEPSGGIESGEVGMRGIEETERKITSSEEEGIDSGNVTPEESDHEEEGAPGESTAPEDDGDSKKRAHVQKSTKRASRKELLELIRRKNEMLQKMEKARGKAHKELENKEDRLLRMAAEFENYKKRTRREWELLQQRANAELIKDILLVLDDFDRALEAAEDEDGHFKSGVKLIYAGLCDVLKSAGLKEVEAQNQIFNPQFHEAVSEVESEEVEEGHVAYVVRKGYILNGHLLRPARVVVARKK